MPKTFPGNVLTDPNDFLIFGHDHFSFFGSSAVLGLGSCWSNASLRSRSTVTWSWLTRAMSFPDESAVNFEKLFPTTLSPFTRLARLKFTISCDLWPLERLKAPERSAKEQISLLRYRKPILQTFWSQAKEDSRTDWKPSKSRKPLVINSIR